MVGIPFANITSQELREKMAYLDAKKSQGGTSGAEYYENICMKSVNQCIGRAIRHRGDFACIILMDTRYKQPRIKAKLPRWITNCGMVESDSFGASISRTVQFFKSLSHMR
jgi:chromosome transmission fidelity protein 1